MIRPLRLVQRSGSQGGLARREAATVAEHAVSRLGGRRQGGVTAQLSEAFQVSTDWKRHVEALPGEEPSGMCRLGALQSYRSATALKRELEPRDRPMTVQRILSSRRTTFMGRPLQIYP